MSLGNIHTPLCVSLAPANENGENRTVLLLGEFGTPVTNPPVEIRIVGDLFTTDPLSGESACPAIMNLNGITTTNVIPLADGPSLFFAQRIDGNLNECSSGTQTIFSINCKESSSITKPNQKQACLEWWRYPFYR